MPEVRIRSGLQDVVLPNGNSYNGGDVVNLSDEDYAELSPTALNDEVIPVSNIEVIEGTNEFLYAHLPIALDDVADGDVVSFTPGFAGKVLSVRFLTDDPGTGDGATTALNMEIGTTNLTGGVTTVTLAGTSDKGELTAGTAVTGNNTFDDDDVITVEASATTPFTGGTGILEVLLQET